MKYIWAIFMVCASLGAEAQNPSCGKWPVISSRLEDGTEVGVFISAAQFEKAPLWSGTGEPPLTIGRVAEIAEKWSKAKYRNFESAKLQTISLSKYGCPGQPAYWYFIVHFSVLKGGQPSHGGHFVAVLFDEMLIEPAKVKDAF